MSCRSVKGNRAQKFSYQICIWHWFDRLATHSVSSGRDTLPQKCGWDAKQSGNNIQLLFTNDVNFKGVVAQPKIQNNIWNSKQHMKFKTIYESQKKNIIMIFKTILTSYCYSIRSNLKKWALSSFAFQSF